MFWNLNKNKRFTIKSVYEWLERDLAGPNFKWIWKASIPLKIKIFLWQLFQNAVLIRDNLWKRNCPGNPICSFCTNMETANHLFFTCSLARTVWAPWVLRLELLAALGLYGNVGHGYIIFSQEEKDSI